MPDDESQDGNITEEQDRSVLKRRLSEQIELHFGNVELGNGISITQARGIDDNWYCDPKDRELDTELRWQDVSDEKIERLADTLAFLDAEGFRFYFPRFMVFALEHEGDDTCAFECAVYASYDCWGTNGHHAMMSEGQRKVVQVFRDYFSAKL